MSIAPPSEDFNPQKYWRTLQRRWLVALLTCLGTVGLATFAAAKTQSSYEAIGQILIESDRKSSLTGVGERLGRVESLKREATPLDTQATVLQSSPLRQSVIQQLQLQHSDGTLLDPAELEITVEALPGTDVIQVSYRNGDRQQAAAVVNELMNAYIRQNLRISTGEANQARSFIEQELPRVKRERDRAATALRQYRRDRQIIALDREAVNTVDRQRELAQQIDQVTTQIASLKAQQQAIQNQLDETGQRSLRAASLSQIPGVQAALTELQQARSQLKVVRTRYRANHPNVQQQQRKVTALKASLSESLSQVMPPGDRVDAGQLQVSPLNQKLITDAAALAQEQQGLERQQAALIDRQNQLNQRGRQMPDLIQDEAGLVKNLRLAQSAYDTLRGKLSEIRLAEIQTLANARIIQPATPPLLATNKARKMLLLGGIGAGICLGVAAAFLVDLLDRRLKSAEEIRALFPYHVLGLIPRCNSVVATIDNPSTVAVTHDAPSIVHEAYRMLQTNLKFLNPDGQPQTIVVSSSTAGEGKSVVSANLAATLAQSGQRVLLIDADLRQPSQAALWDLVNRTGLSHWVMGTYPAETVVQPVQPNLDVMTAGVLPPDAVTFLQSEAFRNHLQMLSQRYDYILLDSPPLLGTADAIILSKIADGLLFVARPGVVDERSALAVQDLLHRSGCQIFGLVINGIDLKHHTAPMFYYASDRRDIAQTTEVS